MLYCTSKRSRAAPLTHSLTHSLVPPLPAMQSILYSLVGGWDKARALEGLAPDYLTMPTGTRVLVDYSREQPTVSVKIQVRSALEMRVTRVETDLPEVINQPWVVQ